MLYIKLKSESGKESTTQVSSPGLANSDSAPDTLAEARGRQPGRLARLEEGKVRHFSGLRSECHLESAPSAVGVSKASPYLSSSLQMRRHKWYASDGVPGVSFEYDPPPKSLGCPNPCGTSGLLHSKAEAAKGTITSLKP